MQVERIDFVNVATRDAERARAWYRSKYDAGRGSLYTCDLI